MHSFDAHHHHDHHQHLIQQIIDREAINTAPLPIFHSNLTGKPRYPTGKKQFSDALIVACAITGTLLFLLLLVVASKVMVPCPNGGNSISASVSLAKAEDYNTAPPPSTTTTTLFTFNVHIELTATDWDTQYGNTTVFLRHPNGTDIDWFPITGARIAYGETRHLDISLKMVSRRLLDGSDPLVSGGGVVGLQVYVGFSGEETSPMFKARPVAEANCDLLVDVESRTLAYSECKPKVSCKAA